MKRINNQWLLLFIMLCSCSSRAQLPGMRIYTQLDGYPGTVGYRINQDSKGFIWVATDNGAACFDGKKFRIIDDKDGLGDKELLEVLPYSDDYLLFIPLLNNIAYSRNGKVITSTTNKALGDIKNVITNHCKLDAITKKAWVGDYYSTVLHCFSGDTITKVNVSITNRFELMKIINNQMYFYIVDSISQQLSPGIYDLTNHKLTPLEVVKITGKTISLENIRTYEVSDDGKYFIAYNINKTVELFKLKDDKLYHLSSLPLNHHVRLIRIDNNGHLWIGLTSSGIEYWGDITKINSATKPLHLFDDIIINDLFIDKDKNLWFTTQQKGLFFLSSRHWDNAKLILQLQLPLYPPRFVTGDSNNNIFIGHSGKACLTFIKNGKSTVHNIPEGSPLGIRHIITTGNHVYMATGMLSRLSVSGENIIFNSPGKLGDIKDIAVYDKKHLVLAQHGFVALVNATGNTTGSENYTTLFKGRATAVSVLPDSSVLIGTPNGLHLKPSLKDSAINIKNGLLSHKHITDITYATGYNVLVGTNAQGLYNYNYKTGNINPVLPGNTSLGLVRNIFRQNDSIYWISTDKGAYRIHFTSGMQIQAVINYTFFDGLPSSDVSAVYVQNDTAYIATSTGLGIIPLKNSLYKPAAPVMWFTDLSFDDSVIYFPAGEIHINHRQNNIQLSLSVISFESIGNIKYVYRLNGLSDKWVETESPEISFSGLSPGKYQLEAYALNSKGIKPSKPLVLSIIVHPAFWQTNWFRISVAIIIAAIVLYIIYRLVISEKNKQYNKMQQKKRLAELELEAIKAQINPHFVYNCLNSIQYFSYKNDLEPVKQYLDIFAKLIRQTMQYSQETFITLEEEINYLENYLRLEKVRFKDKLAYHFEIEENINQMVMIPSMLVQPYVENAMKHGVAKLDETGEVWIRFISAPHDCIKVIIEDNGPGLQNVNTNKERKPLGMRITGSRAETYNQLFGLEIRISITPRKNAKGTRVELLIPPIINEHTKF